MIETARNWICLALVIGATGAVPVPEFTADGYAVPQPHHVFEFPRDHGSHPDFKIEWWYLTGHLKADSGEEFGYQATFFRSALNPPVNQTHTGGRAGPAFGSDHLFLAHMALTDISGKQFYHEERLNRDGWQAWAATDRMDVANGNWSLLADDPEAGMRLNYTIEEDVAVSLQMQPTKPILIFGEDGTSRKGADPAARSYYLTWSRLQTEGSVQIGNRRLTVQGTSWMDHEIASQQLSGELAGWDWVAIQFKDGWEIKAYILRRPDGTPDNFSALMWIDPEGRVHERSVRDFSWERTRWWTSPKTGARYPIEVEITTTDPASNEPITLSIRPRMDAQELTTTSTGIQYWEGACEVSSSHAKGNPRIGSAYLELVGYAAPLGDALR